MAWPKAFMDKLESDTIKRVYDADVMPTVYVSKQQQQASAPCPCSTAGMLH